MKQYNIIFDGILHIVVNSHELNGQVPIDSFDNINDAFILADELNTNV